MSELIRDEDYENWDKVISHCDLIDGLSSVEKKEAKDALQFLRADLGENFLVEASKQGHPFFDVHRSKDVIFSGTNYSYIGTIRNTSPWTRKWMNWLAAALRQIESQNNYRDLLKRIKNKYQFIETISVLDTSYKLSSVGFKVSSIEPKIIVDGVVKKPDLRMTDKSMKDFFVEVSTNTIDEKTQSSLKAISTFSDFMRLIHPSITYSGIIHQEYASEHREEIINKTIPAIEKCQREKSFQELHEQNVVQLGFALSEKDNDFRTWCSQMELNAGQVYMPTAEVDQVTRIRRKIREKQNQFQRDCPNIIVLRNDYLFFKRNYQTLIGDLENEVFRYPHVQMVIIYGMSVRSKDIWEEHGSHSYIRKGYFGIVSLECLILYNKFCSFRTSEQTTKGIRDAFRRY
jgi:hypothetical protein